ncbi:Gfo/Idh/MocA family protein [Silvibacterium bohemicum]|nr:Gfo/Idh/MocA family oxidoreductase [Silvibacterium bohemicum]
MGMAGGGPGSFIGPVHRMAAELDGNIELVAGAFSQDAGKSKAAAQTYGIDEARAYANYEEMIAAETKRADGIDFVAIVTPNHLHLPIARAAMEAGLHVMSDKPATANFQEALDLKNIVERTNRLYALTFTYTGYPLVREAREICRRGELGAIRKVMVEYLQGWLTQPLEKMGQKQAEWRSDPAKSGIGGCIGDIGVHAFNLLEYVTGQPVKKLSATLRTMVAGRALDDDCSAMLVFENGAPGILAASQIAVGERNGLRLRVYGEKGSLEWYQEDPNRLQLKWLDRPDQTLHAGSAFLSEAARHATRLPLGHPEGFVEAFANIYRDFSHAIFERQERPDASLSGSVCGIEEGVRSMAFMERAIGSSKADGAWTALEY